MLLGQIFLFYLRQDRFHNSRIQKSPHPTPQRGGGGIRKRTVRAELCPPPLPPSPEDDGRGGGPDECGGGQGRGPQRV